MKDTVEIDDLYDSDELDALDEFDEDEELDDLEDEYQDFDEFIAKEEKRYDTDDRFRVTRKRPPKSKNRNIMIALGIGVLAILFLTVTVSLILAIKKNTESSYNYNYQKAREYQEAGKYDKAVEHYEKAIAALQSSDKDNIIKLNFALYDCYKQLKLPNSQIEALERILTQEKYNENAVRSVAELYYETGNGDKINNLLSEYAKTSFESYLEKYKVTTPMSDIPSGSYEDDIVVELSTMDEGVKIYYTLDGSEPTAFAHLYSVPVKIEEGNVELKIIAINEIGVVSKSATYKYDIVHGAPKAAVVSLPNGVYTSPRKIEITNIPEGGKAYYTWDSTNPDSSSKEYDPKEQIDLKVGNNVLKIMIVNKFDIESPVAVYVYDLILRGDYTFSAACDALTKKLITLKQIKDASHLLDGSQFKYYEYSTYVKDDVYIYVVGVSVLHEQSYVKQSYYYGINSKTLELYTVTFAKEGEPVYNLIK